MRLCLPNCEEAVHPRGGWEESDRAGNRKETAVEGAGEVLGTKDGSGEVVGGGRILNIKLSKKLLEGILNEIFKCFFHKSNQPGPLINKNKIFSILFKNLSSYPNFKFEKLTPLISLGSIQCCGSGSAWIRIFCLDWDPEFKFRIRIQQKVIEQINKTVNSGLFLLLDSSIE